MNGLKILVIARVKEPSTFASTGVLLAGVGVNIPDDIRTLVVTIIGGASALAVAREAEAMGAPRLRNLVIDNCSVAARMIID